MNRREQIELLLTESAEKLEQINTIFKLSVQQQQLDPKVMIRIKEYLEHLRSILDYLGKEVFEKYCNPDKKGKTGYFPILRKAVTDNAIENGINGAFPGIKENYPDVFNFFNQIQPKYSDNNRWLENLNNLCNQNKHESLTIQLRQDAVINRLAYKNWKTFYWNDGLVEFPAIDGQILLLPGGQFYANEAPHLFDESEFISSFGWIVQKLNDYNIHSAPDLSSIDKSLYSLDSFVVGNFYFSERKMTASQELQWLLPKVWYLKNDLDALMNT